jgi:hypothetical protein
LNLKASNRVRSARRIDASFTYQNHGGAWFLNN